MRQKFAKGSEEWMLFMDFWELTQATWGIEDTDPYWDDVIARCEEYAGKYGPFGKGLAVALLNELERRSKDEKRKTE